MQVLIIHIVVKMSKLLRIICDIVSCNETNAASSPAIHSSQALNYTLVCHLNRIKLPGAIWKQSSPWAINNWNNCGNFSLPVFLSIVHDAHVLNSSSRLSEGIRAQQHLFQSALTCLLGTARKSLHKRPVASCVLIS